MEEGSHEANPTHMLVASHLDPMGLATSGPGRRVVLGAPPPGDMAQSALTGADWTAIVRIIRDQMAAFQRDDGVAAFSYAAPGIRRQFGSAENFMRMVRTAYKAVYRPRRVEFLDLVNAKGQWVQKVGVVGPGGEEAIALYLMKRQKKGGWKIGGCVLVRPEGKRI